MRSGRRSNWNIHGSALRYESNRIEGNTLTLRETDLVINEGLTIGGKPLKDHLEAINHRDAVDHVRDMVQHRVDFSERVLLDLYSLIGRGIDRNNAGRYRSVPVLIQGSQYRPPSRIWSRCRWKPCSAGTRPKRPASGGIGYRTARTHCNHSPVY